MQNNMKSLGMSADDTTLHLQHGALAHIVQQAMHAIRGIKMTSVNHSKYLNFVVDMLQNKSNI